MGMHGWSENMKNSKEFSCVHWRERRAVITELLSRLHYQWHSPQASEHGGRSIRTPAMFALPVALSIQSEYVKRVCRVQTNSFTFQVHFHDQCPTQTTFALVM